MLSWVKRVQRVLLVLGLGVVFQMTGCGLTPALGDLATAPSDPVVGFLSDFTRQWIAAMLF